MLSHLLKDDTCAVLYKQKRQVLILHYINPATKYVIPAVAKRRAGHVVQYFKPKGATKALSRKASENTGFPLSRE